MQNATRLAMNLSQPNRPLPLWTREGCGDEQAPVQRSAVEAVSEGAEVLGRMVVDFERMVGPYFPREVET